MDLAMFQTHPFAGVDVVEKLRRGEELSLQQLDAVIDWADGMIASAPDAPVNRPTAGITVLRGMTASLTTLASDERTGIRTLFDDYQDAEHEVPAALFLGFDLVVRARNTAPDKLGTPPDVLAIQRARSWNTVDDATATLNAMESRLETFGTAVLRNQATLAAKFLADDNRRSFDDAAGDIRRRLDYMASPEFASFFARAKARTELLTSESEVLLQDARRFRQSREFRLDEYVRMTARRNILFTALMTSIDRLQKVLRAALEDQPQKLNRIEASYWWSVNRLGRPVGKAANQVADEAAIDASAEAATSPPAEALATADSDSEAARSDPPPGTSRPGGRVAAAAVRERTKPPVAVAGAVAGGR